MGKAAAAMALEAWKVLGNEVADALVVTKHAHRLAELPWTQLEAGHPVPDNASQHAGNSVLQLVATLQPGDLLIVLLSGGASALVVDTPPSVSLSELQEFYQQLLSSGASISEMNTVRKQFSAIKGGRLAQVANGATVEVGVLSDVPGDDLSIIASGPFYTNSSTVEDVIAIINAYKLYDKLSPSLKNVLSQGHERERKHLTPTTIRHTLLATNTLAIAAVLDAAKQQSLDVHKLPFPLEGEAREMAERVLNHCREFVTKNNGGRLFVGGGETTVTLSGNGKGGRNQEFVLACLVYIINEESRWWQGRDFVILSGGTDGTDGPTDATGACIDSRTVKQVVESGPNPIPYLNNHDAYTYFEQVGALLVTGPTQTNVMDLVLIWVSEKDNTTA